MRARGVVIALLTLAALAALTWAIAGRLGLRPRAARDAGSGGAAAMPAIELTPRWLGGHAPTAASPGAPEVLVVFSDTDPAAYDLLPAVEAWRESYSRWGVVVRGLHRPQFAFAADSAVAGRYARRRGLEFEIALDPSLALAVPSTGHASFVLVGDAGGAVRFACLTPADLAAADRWLRERLRALHPDAAFPDDARAAPLTAEASRPPEERLVRLGAGQVAEGPLSDAPPGVSHAFVTQTRFEEEGRSWIPVPVGRWTPGGDGLTAARGGAANFVAIRYHAGRAGVVVSPPAGAGVKLWVLRDETWLPAAARGPDVKADATGATYVEVDEPRLYLLTSDRGEHVLKLSPDAPGLTLHALTFEDVRGADVAPR